MTKIDESLRIVEYAIAHIEHFLDLISSHQTQKGSTATATDYALEEDIALIGALWLQQKGHTGEQQW